MFVQETFLDLVFLNRMLLVCEQIRFGKALGTRLDPKWNPDSPRNPKNKKKQAEVLNFSVRESDWLPGSLLEYSWAPF